MRPGELVEVVAGWPGMPAHGENADGLVPENLLVMQGETFVPAKQQRELLYYPMLLGMRPRDAVGLRLPGDRDVYIPVQERRSTSQPMKSPLEWLHPERHVGEKPVGGLFAMAQRQLGWEFLSGEIVEFCFWNGRMASGDEWIFYGRIVEPWVPEEEHTRERLSRLRELAVFYETFDGDQRLDLDGAHFRRVLEDWPADPRPFQPNGHSR